MVVVLMMAELVFVMVVLLARVQVVEMAVELVVVGVQATAELVFQL